MKLALAVLMLVGCRSKRTLQADDPMPEPEVVKDAGLARVADAAKVWPELADYPLTRPTRVIAIPGRPDTPRFDVVGPTISGDIAVVGSSQIGFVGVDYKLGKIAWTKPAGTHLAPPLLTDQGIALIAACANPPELPSGERLLGCLRMVSPSGSDAAYLAIRGKRPGVDAFADERGPQATWRDGDRVVWKRGEQAVAIDVISGVARPAPAMPPPLHVEHKGKSWDITQDDGRIVAASKQAPWQSQHPYTAVVGAVYLPEMSPMIRIVNAGQFRDAPEINVFDMDATGSLHAAFAKPLPGISVLAHAASSVGDVAVAVRIDTTLRRDLVAGYAANALLVWVYPLPEHQRVDPVGIAISEDADAVVVFHDGDTVTVLPELSAPPTTPGATRAASKKPTP
jgi:hypothetical protein